MPEEIIKVRFPELPPWPTGVLLANEDLFAVHRNATNILHKLDYANLRALLMQGLTTSRPPIIVGNVWVVEVEAEQAGGQIFLIPEMAGRSFNLRRQGQGIMPTSQWEILDAGGFKLLGTNNILRLGEIFELTEVTAVTGGASGGGGNLEFGAAKPIPTNYTINPVDLGSVFQIRPTAAGLTVTLPDHTAVPLYSIIPFETSLMQPFAVRIQTTLGQKLYLAGQELTFTFIHPGEVLWIYNTTQGWFTCNVKGNWGEVGKVTQGYQVGLNEIALQGQELQRALYPRLWAMAQTIGGSLVSESLWQTGGGTVDGVAVTQAFRGCFSTGNGTTTFRLPNMQGMSVKGLKTGVDASRYQNIPGVYQPGRVGPHRHFTFYDNGTTYNNLALTNANQPEKRAGNNAGEGNANYEYSIRGNANEANVGRSSLVGTDLTGNVIDNIGLHFFIKY